MSTLVNVRYVTFLETYLNGFFQIQFRCRKSEIQKTFGNVFRLKNNYSFGLIQSVSCDLQNVGLTLFFKPEKSISIFLKSNI